MENPFIFCAHHHDHYPKGNDLQGPAVSLKNRTIGNDFSNKDGFSMYHGEVVPGFPAHPHRGFETVTIVLDGTVDHFDSNGAKGRYANGDVQWLTTGKGCQHAEMFPLVHQDKPNPLELFQVWLNLPAKDKFVEPEYKMLWSEEVPVVLHKDKSNNVSEVRIIAGEFDGIKAIKPNTGSWAYNPNNRVSILLVKMAPNAQFRLPKGTPTMNRNLYYYEGNDVITIDNESFQKDYRVKLMSDDEIPIQNGQSEAKFIILEAEPIQEQVFQYGPFVMSTKEEVIQAYRDYEENQFGDWPWDRYDPVNAITDQRFAKYVDGTFHYPNKSN
jgi:redox-sensitive bicupin YhaK (pirin superfamily)